MARSSLGSLVIDYSLWNVNINSEIERGRVNETVTPRKGHDESGGYQAFDCNV